MVDSSMIASSKTSPEAFLARLQRVVEFSRAAQLWPRLQRSPVIIYTGRVGCIKRDAGSAVAGDGRQRDTV